MGKFYICLISSILLLGALIVLFCAPSIFDIQGNLRDLWWVFDIVGILLGTQLLAILTKAARRNNKHIDKSKKYF